MLKTRLSKSTCLLQEFADLVLQKFEIKTRTNTISIVKHRYLIRYFPEI